MVKLPLLFKNVHLSGVTQTLPMESSYRLAVERVRANAERIRRVELPAYEQLINVRAKRYRLIADVYDRLRRQRDDVAPAGEYCAWRRMMDAGDAGSCQCPSAADDDAPSPETEAGGGGGGGGSGRNASSLSMPAFDGCDLPPVEPLIHHRYRPGPSALTGNAPETKRQDRVTKK